jgi:hypothetical protein
MKPRSNMELGNKFVSLIREAETQEQKQAIYDAAYAYAVIAGRDFVKFQPRFFMNFIDQNCHFIPAVSYGYEMADK